MGLRKATRCSRRLENGSGASGPRATRRSAFPARGLQDIGPPLKTLPPSTVVTTYTTWSASPKRIGTRGAFSAMCLIRRRRRRYRARNHCRRTLDTAVHLPCLCQRHHHHCSLDTSSSAPPQLTISWQRKGGQRPRQGSTPQRGPLIAAVRPGSRISNDL